MTPEISIVVPVRRARRTILSTLESIEQACTEVHAEVIVACSGQDETTSLLNQVRGAKVLTFPGRRSIPELRRDGVRAAAAPLVAIVEDHCLFPPRFFARMLEVHSRHPASACGGPVENGRSTLTGWAQYFTRYTAFLPPGRAGYSKALPGNNACYHRDDLLAMATEICDGFWEAEFNQVLARERGPFWYDPQLTVLQRQHRGFFEYIPLRFRHGRCYGSRCGKILSAITPAVAGILFVRALRAVFRSRKHRLKFIALTPVLLIYFCAWAAGETTGYLRGAGQSCSDTD